MIEILECPICGKWYSSNLKITVCCKTPLVQRFENENRTRAFSGRGCLSRSGRKKNKR